MNKRGFTLMELLVYMAIVGIVVVIAGQAYSNSTKMRIRTQSMLKASQVAENVGILFKDDVSQMGAKSAIDIANSTAQNDAFVNVSQVYMPVASGSTTQDFSSFGYVKDRFGTNLDSLAFRRIKYKSNGAVLRVEEIAWYATSDGVLHRTCSVIEETGAEDDECPIDMDIAEGVEKFITTPAKPGAVQADYDGLTDNPFPRLLPEGTSLDNHDFRLVPRFGEDGFAYTTTEPPGGGSKVVVKGFASNYDYDNGEIKTSDYVANQVFVASATNDVDTWNNLCTNIEELRAGVEYEISFKLTYLDNKIKSFCPGRDHMSVGFRKKDDGSLIAGLNDFLFYPPVTGEVSQDLKFRFTSATSVKNVCMAFTFVMYSPSANAGSVAISSLELNQVSTSNYVFVDGYVPSDVNDKKNVKAFRLHLQVAENKETGSVVLVVPTPSNGNKD